MNFFPDGGTQDSGLLQERAPAGVLVAPERQRSAVY